MRLKKLIKHFTFTDADLHAVQLGPRTRIDPRANVATIKAEGGRFPTGVDCVLRSGIARPASVRRWLGFEAVIVHPKGPRGERVTQATFRLFNGEDELWWDGNEWTTGAGWNTEEEIAANIHRLDARTRALAIIVNLRTEDPARAPSLIRLKVLWASAIDSFQEELIYRTLVRSLREQIRPLADLPVKVRRETDRINILDEFKPDSPYKIVDVDSAFNYTADPDRFDDILDAYDAETGEVTLTQRAAAGDVVWVKFAYEPVVAVATSQDFIEVAAVPSLTLTDFSLQAYQRAQDDHVGNRATGEAVVLPAPVQGDLEFVIVGSAGKATDAERLADELKSFCSNNALLHSSGLDEHYRLQFNELYGMRAQTGQSEVHQWQARLMVIGALFWARDVTDAHLVKRVNIGVGQAAEPARER